MTEKPGVATRLMYQLFVALNRKKVSGHNNIIIHNIPAGVD